MLKLGTTASTSGGSGPAQPSSYVIGAALPLSGSSASLGQFFQQGIATAVREINASGGIGGKKLIVKYADNQLEAAASVTAMNQLTSTDGAKAVVMTSSAGVTATAPIATKVGALLLNPGGEDPTLQKLSNNLISNIPNIKTEIDAMLPYLKKHGIKKLAMYAEGDALGATASEAVQEEWQKLGGTFLGAQQEPITVTDHSSVIAKLRSQDPDAVYVLAGGQQAGSFLKQAAQQNLKVQFVGASPLQGGDIVGLAGDAANGILDSGINQPLAASNPKAVSYKKQFAKNYPGQDPSNLYAMFAHDSVLIYADGAKYLRAHKMAYTGVNLVKAIKTIKTFKVAGGTTVIAPDGSSTAPITLSKITNGKFVPFATVKP